jgi:hypothetical protein
MHGSVATTGTKRGHTHVITLTRAHTHTHTYTYTHTHTRAHAAPRPPPSKDVFMGEAASSLVANVDYELPYLRKQAAR